MKRMFTLLNIVTLSIVGTLSCLDFLYLDCSKGKITFKCCWNTSSARLKAMTKFHADESAEDFGVQIKLSIGRRILLNPGKGRI